ncbi:hypothetical protein RW107_04050 [Bacillus subtilis]|nr:hypothetical protein [Bacillus subtilis]WOA23158.1 hypothetical protein RW107_04050 [Bacillus subtilis]
MSAVKIENETIADGFYARVRLLLRGCKNRLLPARPNNEWLRDQGSNHGADFSKGKRYMRLRGQLKRDMCFVFKKEEELAAVVMLLPATSEWDLGSFGDEWA